METGEERKEHKKRLRQNQRLRKEAKLRDIFRLIANSAPDLASDYDGGSQEDCLDQLIAELFKPIENRYIVRGAQT